MTFGQRLNTLRQSHHMTFSDLAAASGISRSYLYQLEADRSSPTLEVTAKLAHALGIAVPELLEPLYIHVPPPASYCDYCGEEATLTGNVLEAWEHLCGNDDGHGTPDFVSDGGGQAWSLTPPRKVQIQTLTCGCMQVVGDGR